MIPLKQPPNTIQAFLVTITAFMFMLSLFAACCNMPGIITQRWPQHKPLQRTLVVRDGVTVGSRGSGGGSL